ncbi:hypothetical protein BGZ99_003518 [Dissophora globulifera]|uniref:Uncharacterized protein n=1 Tax=Dissophora globulifera TaxID=979702 RepID=A0A9P6RPM5_9FUNG|nr:hypothetical protein BGZ99_003518 [Dissophora globulifera]
MTAAPVPLPSLNDIVSDLGVLRSASISLSQPPDGFHPLGKDTIKGEPLLSSLEKLEKFKASTEKSQREEGVVENGFEVAADFLKMQQQLSISKQEMNTLHERMTGLEKELNEVRQLIAFNPIQ